MVTVGFDPSITNLGYCVFMGDRLIHYDVFKTYKKPPAPPVDIRLRLIRDFAVATIKNFGAESVVVEDYIFRPGMDSKRNMGDLKTLIYVIGVLIEAARVPSLTLYKPHEWKGKKQKQTTIIEAQRVYGLGKLNNNAADAIMMTHHHIKKMEVERLQGKLFK